MRWEMIHIPATPFYPWDMWISEWDLYRVVAELELCDEDDEYEDEEETEDVDL